MPGAFVPQSFLSRSELKAGEARAVSVIEVHYDDGLPCEESEYRLGSLRTTTMY